MRLSAGDSMSQVSFCRPIAELKNSEAESDTVSRSEAGRRMDEGFMYRIAVLHKR